MQISRWIVYECLKYFACSNHFLELNWWYSLYSLYCLESCNISVHLPMLCCCKFHLMSCLYSQEISTLKKIVLLLIDIVLHSYLWHGYSQINGCSHCYSYINGFSMLMVFPKSLIIFPHQWLFPNHGYSQINDYSHIICFSQSSSTSLVIPWSLVIPTSIVIPTSNCYSYVICLFLLQWLFPHQQ